VKKGFVVAVVLMLSAPAATLGQERPEPHARRDQIRLLEGVLQRAAGLGAEQVARKLQMLEPGVTTLAGQPRARGFVLDGYGVFFDVEVPALMQNVVGSLLVLQRDAQMATSLEQLRQVILALPAGQERMRAEQAFSRLEMQVGPVPQRGRGPQPEVRATDSAEAAPVASVATAPAPAPPGDPIPANWDPLAEYTRAVQSQLIEAMLTFSHGLNLGPEEWLTVAARDSNGPMGLIDDSQTIVLRVKGSDLAIYAADRNRLDEIRKKVEVRVF
jgi:hypothetical protein